MKKIFYGYRDEIETELISFNFDTFKNKITYALAIKNELLKDSPLLHANTKEAFILRTKQILPLSLEQELANFPFTDEDKIMYDLATKDSLVITDVRSLMRSLRQELGDSTSLLEVLEEDEFDMVKMVTIE